jgi:TPR repeat protein
MADEHKLPAQIAARALAPAEQSGSLVTRGLEAIKNRQQALVLFGVETDAKKSFLEGEAAEKRGDYAEAVKWYRKAADQGYAEAQLNLGMMYDEGRAPDEANELLDQAAVREGRNPGYYYDGGASYFFETLHCLRLAAEQGYVKAQFKLGVLLYDHLAVEAEWEVEARKWFRLAADQGYAEAQFNLGMMYHEGRSVPQDYGEAEKWFRLAGNQGYAEAQFNLGTMYEKGQGVSQDDATAVSWYRKAADQGHAGAQSNLGLSIS